MSNKSKFKATGSTDNAPDDKNINITVQLQQQKEDEAEAKEEVKTPPKSQELPNGRGKVFFAEDRYDLPELSTEPNEIAKTTVAHDIKTRMSDIAGMPAVKHQLQKFIHNYIFQDNLKRLGGKNLQIPRSILMEGPPGTAKSLSAEALANALDAHYIYLSSSELIYGFTGSGRMKVGRVFDVADRLINEVKKAHGKQSRVVVCIDEFDEVVKPPENDQSGIGEIRAEILTRTDGLKANPNVILVATTNHPDIIDDAVKSRFGKKIHYPLPLFEDRKAIWRHLTKGVKFSANFDDDNVALKTYGMSGRDLRHIFAETVSNAIERNLEAKVIMQQDCDKAIDDFDLGLPTNVVLTPREKDDLAGHEAAHAIVGYLAEGEGMELLRSVSTIPRKESLGITISQNKDVKVSEDFMGCKAKLRYYMAGRAYEELAHGKEGVSTGASEDIKMSTELARKMVANWGYDEKTGMVNLEELYAVSDMGEQFNGLASSEAGKNLHMAVKAYIDNAYNEAKAQLIEHRQALFNLKNYLYKYEEADRKKFMEVTKLPEASRVHLEEKPKLTPQKFLANNADFLKEHGMEFKPYPPQ